MRLTRWERTFAEQIFAAILPGDPSGARPFGSVDTTEFWRCVEGHGAPTLVPGLRLMLVAVWTWPLLDPRLRRPFPWLAGGERERWLAEKEAGPGRLGRQLVSTLKILAAFAWFDDPGVRREAGAP